MLDSQYAYTVDGQQHYYPIFQKGTFDTGYINPVYKSLGDQEGVFSHYELGQSPLDEMRRKGIQFKDPSQYGSWGRANLGGDNNFGFDFDPKTGKWRAYTKIGGKVANQMEYDFDEAGNLVPTGKTKNFAWDTNPGEQNRALASLAVAIGGGVLADKLGAFAGADPSWGIADGKLISGSLEDVMSGMVGGGAGLGRMPTLPELGVEDLTTLTPEEIAAKSAEIGGAVTHPIADIGTIPTAPLPDVPATAPLGELLGKGATGGLGKTIGDVVKGIGGAVGGIADGAKKASGGFPWGSLAGVLANMYSQNQLQNQLESIREDAYPFKDRLLQSYTDPNSYYNSQEGKALSDIVSNKYDRLAAAGGLNANPIGRAKELQDAMQMGLERYRQGLSDTLKSIYSSYPEQMMLASNLQGSNPVNSLFGDADLLKYIGDNAGSWYDAIIGGLGRLFE